MDVLDAAGPSSLDFKGEGVMPSEIAKSVEKAMCELDDLEENAGTDKELLNSHIARFKHDEKTKQMIGVTFRRVIGEEKLLIEKMLKSPFRECIIQ